MVDITLAPTPAALPDRGGVPGVWSRVTNLTVDRGDGSWLATTAEEVDLALRILEDAITAAGA